MKTAMIAGFGMIFGVLVASAQVMPGDGVSIVQKPKLVTAEVATNAPAAAATTNALAAMKAEEKTLADEQKRISTKIGEVTHPLSSYRQRMMAQDKELMALAKVIREKQAELEALLLAKYPDIAAKTKERDELTRSYSDVSVKLRDLRKRMDQAEAALQQDAGGKDAAK